MHNTLFLCCLLAILGFSTRNNFKATIVQFKSLSLSPHTLQKFTLSNLDSRKALVLILQDYKLSALAEFSLQIENKNHQKINCAFKYASNICVMETSLDSVTIAVQCLNENCSFTLVISQRVIVKVQVGARFNRQMMTPGEVFKLPKSNYTAMLTVYSIREEHQLLTQEIAVYSNVHAFHLQQIEELDSTSSLFGLKPIRTQNDRYLFVDAGKIMKNQDLRLVVRFHDGKLQDSVPLTDFIETYGNHSKNQYSYTPRHRPSATSSSLQVNLRVFAPRDNSKLPLTLFLRGHQSNNTVEILKLHIPILDWRGQKFYDLSLIVTGVHYNKYETLLLQIRLDQLDDRAVFIQVQIEDTEKVQVTIFDHVFLLMEEAENIDLIVQPQIKFNLAKGDREISILTNEEQSYQISYLSCSLLKGCQISVKAIKRCESCSLSFNLTNQTFYNNILYYDVQGDIIEGKVQIDEYIYFRYAIAAKSSVKILIQSVNVILYANFDEYARCSAPKPSCHQYVINQHNPMTITNKEDQPSQLLFNLFGLEKTAFKVHFVLESQALVLKLGRKFTYVFDNEEDQIVLKFVLDNNTINSSSQYLSFTLVAPVGALRLQVSNINGVSLSSSEGFVVVPLKNIAEDLFEVRVSKIGRFVGDFIHLTLIAMLDGSTVRLDQTNTHYERYEPNAVKKFVVEYEPTESNAINIFTENLQSSHGKMILVIRQIGSELDQPLLKKVLERDLEWVYLDEQMQSQDTCTDLNCELQLQITNSNQINVEQSLTLLAAQSVIGLTDSIWSGFQINELTRSSHFYFLPHAPDHSTTIIFQTDDTHLYIDYLIHNFSQNINPQNWPFLHSHTQLAGHVSGSQLFDIPADDKQIKACWPTCVILININEAHTENEDVSKEHSLIQTFRILATNSIIELPQDMKLQFALARAQQKSLFIRTSKFWDTKQFTFFTYFSVGRAKIIASLVSRNKELPLGPNNTPFVLDYLETTIPLDLLIGTAKGHGLQQSETLLKLTIIAESSLKMTIQFTSSLREIQTLKMQDLQMVYLSQSEQRWYGFVPDRDFLIKFYRMQGSPFLKVVRCEQQDYVQCLSSNKQKIKGELQMKLQIMEMLESNSSVSYEIKTDNSSVIETMVSKAYEVEYQHCQQCIFFIWVYSGQGDLRLTINVRTSYSEIELKEQNIINERIQPHQHNSYLINAVSQEQTVITIRILQGTAKVEISDRFSILFNDTLNSVDDDYRDFIVEALDLPGDATQQEEQDQRIQQGRLLSNSKARRDKENSVLRHVHVTVTGISQIAVQFLLSYSVAESSLYLQDGMVIQKQLVPNTSHTFYYHNLNSKSHAYLTLSSSIQYEFNQTDAENKLKTHFYYYPDANERNNRQEFSPELPPSHNQNYLGSTSTYVYQLPAKFELMQVQLQSKYHLKVTASINHKELIYLPLGFDYLIKLHPKQHLHLVVNTPKAEYLELTVRKCDQSVPSLLYTNDATQFKKGLFSTQLEVDANNFKQFIKTKSSSNTIHIKIVGDDSVDSLLSVAVAAADIQNKRVSRFVAGNKGFLSYEMRGSNQVEVIFKPITCDNKECQTNVLYFLLVADRIDELMSELNCANNRFITADTDRISAKTANQIYIDKQFFDPKTGDYRYKITLQNSRAFLGVKAAVVDVTREQIPYIPLQINSLYGSLEKVSVETFMIVGIYLGLLVFVVIAVSTKCARRGYRPISNNEQ